jgi:hypothetical protein
MLNFSYINHTQKKAKKMKSAWQSMCILCDFKYTTEHPLSLNVGL